MLGSAGVSAVGAGAASLGTGVGGSGVLGIGSTEPAAGMSMEPGNALRGSWVWGYTPGSVVGQNTLEKAAVCMSRARVTAKCQSSAQSSQRLCQNSLEEQ